MSFVQCRDQLPEHCCPWAGGHWFTLPRDAMGLPAGPCWANDASRRWSKCKCCWSLSNTHEILIVILSVLRCWTFMKILHIEIYWTLMNLGGISFRHFLTCDPFASQCFPALDCFGLRCKSSKATGCLSHSATWTSGIWTIWIDSS